MSMDRRAFILAGIANGALAVAPAALAAPVLEGQATRLSDGKVRLDWNARSQPTTVYVSSDPDAPQGFMRALRANVVGGAVALPVASAPRPYFMLATKQGAGTRVAERLLPLQGGRNFRDLGGYRAADGRQVKWGHIYRSGVMSGLTQADLTYLSNLGVQVVCDLRSVQERGSEPNPMLKADGPQVVAFDYEMGSSISQLMQATTRAQAVDAFASAYLGFIDMLTPNYTDMFARLVRREGPLAMNCSAGKDRTGMGSALVLSVLGVPRDAVVADYGLSQIYTPPSLYTKQIKTGAPMSGVSSQQAHGFSRMPPEVLNVIMGSDPQVMRQALAQVDRKFGGPVELAKARFGLTDAKVAHLRSTYLI
jgi:protein-tyrosine phosphatase